MIQYFLSTKQVDVIKICGLKAPNRLNFRNIYYGLFAPFICRHFLLACVYNAYSCVGIWVRVYAAAFSSDCFEFCMHFRCWQLAAPQCSAGSTPFCHQHWRRYQPSKLEIHSWIFKWNFSFNFIANIRICAHSGRKQFECAVRTKRCASHWPAWLAANVRVCVCVRVWMPHEKFIKAKVAFINSIAAAKH